MDVEYDYIVVGAGPAGCVVANRLSRMHSVLLLESGGANELPEVRLPAAGFLGRSDDSGVISSHPTTAVNPTTGEPIRALEGHGLGGGSAANGMLYVRGRASDFDAWDAAGATGWGWTDLLPYFRKQTALSGGDPRFYGSGELELSRMEAHPLSAAFVEAAVAAGYEEGHEPNGGSPSGVSYAITTRRSGERLSASAAFLDPVRFSTNLTIRTRTRVTRILFDGDRVTGVEAAVGSVLERFRCRHEVILSAGAISSPQILQRSGIGDAGLLHSLDIPLVSDLPQVGKNLQDHLWMTLKFQLATDADSLNRELAGEQQRMRARGEWAEKGSSVLETIPTHVLVFVPPGASPVPEMQLSMRPFGWSTDPRTGSVIDDIPTMSVVIMSPRSYARGSVTISSKDASAHHVVDIDYLGDDRDIAVLRAGIGAIRRIVEQPPLAGYVVSEISPGADASEAELIRAVHASNTTSYHPAGTCRMGSDDASVVDPQLRVRGVRGLRVIDNSVMPSIPSGNPMAAAYVIGERGAALVLGQDAGAEI
ncbi:MAG: GMC family oxidoreductase N-terminal domain-containing protein [Niabella sp.]